MKFSKFLAVGAALAFHASAQAQIPQIVEDPVAQTVAVGANATFTVVATGQAPTYQWYHATTLIPSATNNSFTITAATNTDVGNYSAVVANGFGSVTSAIAYLSVMVVPVITTQPQAVNVAISNSIVMNVTNVGDTVTYWWRKNGGNLTNGAVVSGLTKSTLTITNAGTNDTANYSVVVSNVVGVATSSDAYALVVTPPVITTVLSNKAVAVGSSYTILAGVSGSLLNYLWKSNTVVVPEVTGSSWTLSNVDTNWTTTYSVEVTNLAGKVTNSTLITVMAPITFNTILQGTNLATNSTLTLSADVSGDNATFQWRKGGSNYSCTTSNLSSPRPAMRRWVEAPPSM